MPTIVMASSKGGCGKSTTAVILATELAQAGTNVTLIDVDPNQPITRWSQKSGMPTRLKVVSHATEYTLLNEIESAEVATPFVIVDLEGTANLTVAQAISRADLVIVPIKGSHLDAAEAVKAIRFIKLQEQSYRRPINFTLLYTQTSPTVRSRTLRTIEQNFQEQGIPALNTALHERDAYRAIFAFGGTLSSLDPTKVGGLPGAIRNSKQLVAELVGKLADIRLKGAA